MTKTLDRKKAGFTQVELIVVVVIGALLVLWVLPTLAGRGRHHKAATRISCVNNLKQIGVAYRVWATDNNDLMPAQAGGTNGWKDLLTNGNAGAYCWTNFTFMHSELGELPKVVVCPSDERQVATNFGQTGVSGRPAFNNKTLSYFVGVGANETYPQSILGGDRNLCSGVTPTNDYGFSPKNGAGNDVTIRTNIKISPISWSSKMHSANWPGGAGNILLGDGSVQQCSSSRFGSDYQVNAIDSGNWPSNNIPKSPSFRLVFP